LEPKSLLPLLGAVAFPSDGAPALVRRPTACASREASRRQVSARSATEQVRRPLITRTPESAETEEFRRAPAPLLARQPKRRERTGPTVRTQYRRVTPMQVSRAGARRAPWVSHERALGVGERRRRLLRRPRDAGRSISGLGFVSRRERGCPHRRPEAALPHPPSGEGVRRRVAVARVARPDHQRPPGAASSCRISGHPNVSGRSERPAYRAKRELGDANQPCTPR
jgi:hypothetical protein